MCICNLIDIPWVFFWLLFSLFQLLTYPLSPNESFLRYLILPQDNELAIDLRQTAVVIMAHLDRLATPCMPPQCSSPTSHKVMACNIKYSRMFSLEAYLNFRMQGKQLLSFFKFWFSQHNLQFWNLSYLGNFYYMSPFTVSLEVQFCGLWTILSYHTMAISAIFWAVPSAFQSIYINVGGLTC